MNVFRKCAPLVLAAALTLGGCSQQNPAAPGAKGGDEKKLNVTVAFYAVEYLAQQVGGDAVQVTNLTAPGVDPHDMELTPQQMKTLSGADLVVYLNGFQSTVDNAIKEAGVKNTLDVAKSLTLLPSEGHDEHEHADHKDGDHKDSDHKEADHKDGDHKDTDHKDADHKDADHKAADHEHGDHADHKDADHKDADHKEADHKAGDHDEHAGHHHHHGAFDPHFWTDPQLMAELAGKMAAKFSELEPSKKDVFAKNADQVSKALKKLDENYTRGLASCQRREFIPSHAAFSYMSKRYNLTQVSVAGLSPDEEPSPARIAAIQAEAKKYGITTIFFEPGTSQAIAQSIATDLKLETGTLDPVEGLTKDSAGKDYPSIMQANLEALKKANGCS